MNPGTPIGPCGRPGTGAQRLRSQHKTNQRLPIVQIRLVSDLHGTLPQLDRVVRMAPTFDLAVLAGDSLNISSAASIDAQSVVIQPDKSWGNGTIWHLEFHP